MDTAIVLYEGFDELDAVGPFEVLANAGRYGGPFEPRLVTLDPVERVTASHGLRVEPHGTLEGTPDLLLVPGGGWTTGDGGAREQVEDGALPAAVADAFEAGATVASVCTGAMILAHAGLLDGRPAATHAGAREDLAAFAEVREERVVDDDRVLTAGGVTAGLDLAVHLVGREAGREVADRVVEEMEYRRERSVYPPSRGLPDE
jgi:transcriptional regulator GlxA family with amidase domain